MAKSTKAKNKTAKSNHVSVLTDVGNTGKGNKNVTHARSATELHAQNGLTTARAPPASATARGQNSFPVVPSRANNPQSRANMSKQKTTKELESDSEDENGDGDDETENEDEDCVATNKNSKGVSSADSGNVANPFEEFDGDCENNEHDNEEEDYGNEGDEEEIADEFLRLRDENESLTEKLRQALRIIKKKQYENVDGAFVDIKLLRIQHSTVVKHVKLSLFPKTKYVDDDLLANYPQIVERCFAELSVKNMADQQAMMKSVVSSIRYGLSQHKKYVKDRLRIAVKEYYKGGGTLFQKAIHLVEIRKIPYGQAQPAHIDIMWWYFNKLLPCVNGEWKKVPNRIASLCSDVVTRTDEGFVLWVLSTSMSTWIAEAAKDESENNRRDEETVEVEATSKERSILTTKGSAEFQAFNDAIAAIRESENNTEWEKGYRHMMTSTRQSNTKRNRDSSASTEKKSKKKSAAQMKSLVDF